MGTIAIQYPHLTVNQDGSAYLSRLPRIHVSTIVADYLGHGWSPDQIAEQYPHLKKAEVHSALTYYFDHKDEIEEQLWGEQKSCGQTKASPLGLKLSAAKEKWNS